FAFPESSDLLSVVGMGSHHSPSFVNLERILFQIGEKGSQNLGLCGAQAAQCGGRQRHCFGFRIGGFKCRHLEEHTCPHLCRQETKLFAILGLNSDRWAIGVWSLGFGVRGSPLGVRSASGSAPNPLYSRFVFVPSVPLW